VLLCAAIVNANLVETLEGGGGGGGGKKQISDIFCNFFTNGI
jgi:hypothetical protein